MYINIESIQTEATNYQVYNRGLAYYRQRRVLGWSICERDDGSCDVTARVKGSHTYSVTAEIGAAGDVIDYTCDCPAYETYEGMCKHCVAALIDVYHSKYNKNTFSKPANGDAARSRAGKAVQPPEVRTDYWAQGLLRAFQAKEEARYIAQQLGTIRIVPAFHMLTGREVCELTFTIGVKHQYVVKDIAELISNFEQQKHVSYGKNLSFTHCMEALDEQSRRLAALLKRRFRESAAIKSAAYGYSYDDKRTLYLSQAAMDEFFDLYSGELVCTDTLHARQALASIDARSEYADHCVRFMTDDPEIQVSADISGEGALTLRCDQSSFCLGGYVYIYRDKARLYRCKMDKSDAIRALMNGFRGSGGKLVFSKEDAPNFCANVLPEIERYVTIVDPGGKLAAYRPEPMTAHVFLDAPSRDMITAMVVAGYGEDMVDISTGKSARCIDGAQYMDQYGGADIDGGAITGGSDEIAQNGHIELDEEKSFRHQRDLRAERQIETAVSRIISIDEDGAFVLTGEDAIYELVTNGIERLQAIATVHVSDRLRRYSLKTAGKVSVGVSLDGGLLELDIDMGQFPIEELTAMLNAYRERRKYYRLKSGEFLKLSEGALSDVAQLADGLQLTDKQLMTGHIEAPAFRAMYLDGLFREENRKASLRRDPSFRQLVRTVKNAADSDYPIPAPVQGVLRDYQETGYRWFRTLEECKLCGILADDMGLGKTVQLICALLNHYAGAPDGDPSLIACPTSLVLNWAAELKKFAPQLPARLILGAQAQRRQLIEGIEPGETVITSYDLIKRDIDLYNGRRFHYFVIDEAQYIKNQATKGAQAVKSINCVQRFALTGTPIENRLSELWSIFDFLMPGYLYNYNRFRQKFELPVVKNQDENARAQLKRMISPFILRRLKRDVLSELPPKVTTVLPVELGEKQRDLYRAAALLGLQQIHVSGGAQVQNEVKMKVFALLTRLRQLCCDPSLCFADYQGGSAKLDTCMELIRQAISGGHKLLLFSQFTSMLDIIKKRLTQEGISHLVLQGSTPKRERLEMTNQFNSDDTAVFLISLKAGGTGLNLTGADMVIHYDPWWNLAAQEQATDRAHRIGQTRSLQVYKLIAAGTIEEKILKLQEMKGDLASIVESEEGTPITGMSASELLALIKD